MDNCYINLGAVKTKEIDGELYISCWNFSKALAEKEREISDLCKENDELEKKISELKSELATKESLMNIMRCHLDGIGVGNTEALKKFGIDITADDEEQLPFSCDEYTDALFEELEDLRKRHQQDCITINQLQTTIDTLIDRYAKLRK